MIGRDSLLNSARGITEKNSLNVTMTQPITSTRRVIIDEAKFYATAQPTAPTNTVGAAAKKSKGNPNNTVQIGEDNPFSSSSDPEETAPPQMVY